MERRRTLRDGTEVAIRDLEPGDAGQSLAFFRALPAEDRAYLRVDVTDRLVVERRIQLAEHGRVRRLVAVAGGEIIADGALELDEPGWKRHSGEIRVIVARPFRRRGLGTLMVRELYLLASAERLDLVVTKMMRPQEAARRIFRRLGFGEIAMLPDYVRDQNGHAQDLVVMYCDLTSLWDMLEIQVSRWDWQRTR